jgi:hypothetical protein
MTEAEWLACKDPAKMIRCLRWKQRAHAGRKCRLFAVACCRRVYHLMTDDRIRHAVDIAERFADGEVDADTKTQATRTVSRVASKARVASAEKPPPPCGGIPADSAVVCALSKPAEVVWFVAAAAGCRASEERHAPAWLHAHDAELAATCDLMREIVANPFRPVSITPAWQTPAVLSLAQAAYNERGLPRGLLDPARLAVLADALEEAGCSEKAILDHLRHSGPHVRGCWPVDLLLQKA